MKALGNLEFQQETKTNINLSWVQKGEICVETDPKHYIPFDISKSSVADITGPIPVSGSPTR